MVRTADFSRKRSTWTGRRWARKPDADTSAWLRKLRALNKSHRSIAAAPASLRSSAVEVSRTLTLSDT